MFRDLEVHPNLQRCGVRRDLLQGASGGPAQIEAEEQVFAGVSGNGELRKQHDAGALRRVFVEPLDDVAGVGGGIGQYQLRCHRRCADESQIAEVA